MTKQILNYIPTEQRWCAMGNKYWRGHWHTIYPFYLKVTHIHKHIAPTFDLFSLGSYRRITLLHPYINCKSIFCLYIWFVYKEPCAMMWMDAEYTYRSYAAATFNNIYINAEILPKGMQYQKRHQLYIHLLCTNFFFTSYRLRYVVVQSILSATLVSVQKMRWMTIYENKTKIHMIWPLRRRLAVCFETNFLTFKSYIQTHCNKDWTSR